MFTSTQIAHTNTSKMFTKNRKTILVLGAPIDTITWDETILRIQNWSNANKSRYICICNVHSVVSASKDSEFMSIIKNSDISTPDGAPVAWIMRRLGAIFQERINGPDLMLRYCQVAAQSGEKIFLYGNTQKTLEILEKKLVVDFPKLRIAGTYSPPFRSLTEEEDAEIIHQINESGAGTVWVSLGCPKQEKWMADHRGKINAVMIGVGAAFDYHAGTLQRAPLWMQRSGLEWFYRLVKEPRRLWRRYLSTNLIFCYSALRQLISGRA